MGRLDDGEVLIGKLALGRGWLTRDDARTVLAAVEAGARAGRRESFSSAAVRLGYLEARRRDELAALVRGGSLVCRGRCGRQVPLAGLAPAEAVACRGCGGPVYAAPGAALAAAAAEDGDGPAKGGRTVLDLSVPELSAVPVAVPVARAAPSGFGLTPGSPGAHPAEVAEPGADTTADWSEAEAEADVERTQELDADAAPTLHPSGAPPPAPDFEPFALGADLQVLAPIGRGGMGSVYRARRADGSIVAVKLLAAPPLPDVLSRFEREVKVAARLDHPSIVKVLGTGTAAAGPDAGKPYFVMEHVAGRDLVAWAAERERTPAEVVHMVRAVCDAIEHAHARGVIHRDLKPGNILVRAQDDRPVVCDFGLAKWRAEIQDITKHTGTGEILGTPSYMPPEQALGKRTLIGPPTDVYALGAVLYHLLTGRPPFQGPKLFQTIAKVVNEPPVAPRQLDPRIPAALEAAVLKALAKEPAQRFPTCGAFSQALAAAV